MLQAGADIFTVSKWLGHKSVTVTERACAFLDTNRLHPVATKLAEGKRMLEKTARK